MTVTRYIGRTGRYVMLVLFRFPESTFSWIWTLLRKRTTKKAITNFLQRYPELVTRKKVGYRNLYSLSEEGRRVFEEEFMTNETLRLELQKLEEDRMKWAENRNS